MPHQNIDVQQLLSSRQAFDAFVYTPLNEAIEQIQKRKNDPELERKVLEALGGDIPPEFTQGIRAVLFRQITTPNYEIRRFMHIMDMTDGLTPLFGEHRDDKYTSNNEYKHSWGKLHFSHPTDTQFEHVNVIDHVAADGKKISDVRTTWGQPLIDFHHELFDATYRPVDKDIFVNISPWLERHGKSAKNYYFPVLTLFLCHAILFENFTLDDHKERAFIENIFLPAFIKVYDMTGYKPLIVGLLPTDIEATKFWICHPHDSRKYIQDKIDIKQ